MEYILVSKENCAEVCQRLDSLIEQYKPHTLRYADPIQPNDPQYPYVLIPIDDRAQAALTPEEWASRLATMPAAFIPPDPRP